MESNAAQENNTENQTLRISQLLNDRHHWTNIMRSENQWIHNSGDGRCHHELSHKFNTRYRLDPIKQRLYPHPRTMNYDQKRKERNINSIRQNHY